MKLLCVTSIRWMLLWVGVAAAAGAVSAQVPARSPDRILAGTITRADHQHYRDVPFIVPRGTTRLVIAFDHDGRDQKTVIDLGVRDARGFRGASGGNKAELTISASDATPAYLAGRIAPGRWLLALAVPNIRAGVTAHWRARLWFLKPGEPSPAAPVVDRGPGWYRGDLHLHSAHSDGVCASQSGAKVPCPLVKTLEAASARGLDFIAITDHNTVSQLDAARALQPLFDRLLLIPGQEVTTFFGHFNVFGVSEPIDFRIGAGGRSFAATVDRVHALGGLVSINHPALPSGEICMGCGWAMPGPAAIGVDAIEAVNGGAWRAGGTPDGAFSGIGFWARAVADAPVTAIGGSDNHDATQPGETPGAIGRPTTVVEASALTQQAILDGIRRGRVFVDMDAGAGSLLDVVATSVAVEGRMGETISAPAGTGFDVTVTVRLRGHYRVELIVNDQRVGDRFFDEAGHLSVRIAPPSGRSIIRPVVRTAEGRLVLLGNAIRIDVARP
ncbi:MAG: hypothetical protein B7Y45_11755 [Sphingomonas sp. 28-66-16]|nr:MAG: hypothetical protein B7Y45_11755 [Sphingomonas sp. 28-66-16]